MSELTKATDLAKKIYEQNIGEKEAIDLNKIAKKNGITLLEVSEKVLKNMLKDFEGKVSFSFDNISGMYVAKGLMSNDKAIILVNKNENPYNQRFTIAHELGHYFLNYNDKTNVISIKLKSNMSEYNDSIEEKQADAFANELLMPKEKIFSYIKNSSLGPPYKMVSRGQLIDLALTFAVSKEAMQNRLYDLGYYLR